MSAPSTPKPPPKSQATLRDELEGIDLLLGLLQAGAPKAGHATGAGHKLPLWNHYCPIHSPKTHPVALVGAHKYKVGQRYCRLTVSERNEILRAPGRAHRH